LTCITRSARALSEATADTSGFKQEKTVSEAGGYGQPDMGLGK